MAAERKKVKKRFGKVTHGQASRHAEAKAREIRSRYGPDIDHAVLLRILEDRRSIRYPVEIRFTADGIEPGMFGKTEQIAEDPADGYVIYLHEHFRDRPEVLPALVLYQSVLVNYGDLATAYDAEIFGSGVLGMDQDEYYELIVDLTDSIARHS